MITQLKIENYKSIQELTLDVGRVNVLIGENGCGKSNILEAITLAGATAADKLDNEFLSSRGIRVTDSKLMRSAFRKRNVKYNVIIGVKFEGQSILQGYVIEHDNKIYSKWKRLEYESNLADAVKTFIKLLDTEDNEVIKILRDSLGKSIYNSVKLIHGESRAEKYLSEIRALLSNEEKIKDFIIFSPENSALRNFEKEGQIEPLGVNGEGLLKLLVTMQADTKYSDQEYSAFNEIIEILELFDWYESLKIPTTLKRLEKLITIKDCYLEMPFDQRSANEGFLLVLFYITLVVSKYTPKIFAIDNIDTSLNPKLCTKLIKELTRLAKKYDKQIFLTSHNPAILDGIDLGDEEQRLFVVSRNDQGHTCCDRLDLNDKPKSATKARLLKLFKDNPIITQKIEETFNNSEEPLKLSEAFLRGYLGGLPTGF